MNISQVIPRTVTPTSVLLLMINFNTADGGCRMLLNS